MKKRGVHVPHQKLPRDFVQKSEKANIRYGLRTMHPRVWKIAGIAFIVLLVLFFFRPKPEEPPADPFVPEQNRLETKAIELEQPINQFDLQEEALQKDVLGEKDTKQLDLSR